MKSARLPLLTIRQWIFENADARPQIGPISEEIRWGQASYLTHKTGAGSALRLDRWQQDRIGLFFPCKTQLGNRFAAEYDGVLRIRKNRVISLQPDEILPESALRHCIALALTYHLWKDECKVWERL